MSLGVAVILLIGFIVTIINVNGVFMVLAILLSCAWTLVCYLIHLCLEDYTKYKKTKPIDKDIIIIRKKINKLLESTKQAINAKENK